jgi:HlyD family secretion protein
MTFGWPRGRGLLGLAALALLVGLALGWAILSRARALPEGLLQANGRIEGDHVTVASKFAGRVHRLAVREGDAVTAGQLLVVLDDTQVRARESQATAQLTQAGARVTQATAAVREAEAALVAARAARVQAHAAASQASAAVAAVDARLAAARSALTVLRSETVLAIGSAEARVASAEAAVARAEAAAEQAAREAKRLSWLYERELVDRQRSEQADLTSTVATKELLAARSALVQALRALDDARLGPTRVRVREDEVTALVAERAAQAAALRQAEAATAQAEASVGRVAATVAQAQAAQAQAAGARDQSEAGLVEARSVREDLTIVAPSAGIVTARLVEPGEVVAAGTPLLDLVDLDRLYLKVFVPEVQIGKLRLGLPARIHTDAFPDRPFPAVVRYIAARAEFTPKEVQTPDERVKLVYAVKLFLEANPEHRLTPGLPADAVIRWKEGVAWQPPRW